MTKITEIWTKALHLPKTFQFSLPSFQLQSLTPMIYTKQQGRKQRCPNQLWRGCRDLTLFTNLLSFVADATYSVCTLSPGMQMAKFSNLHAKHDAVRDKLAHIITLNSLSTVKVALCCGDVLLHYDREIYSAENLLSTDATYKVALQIIELLGLKAKAHFQVFLFLL